MALKHSRQRDAIYNFLEGRKDHPTADAVYMGVRENLPGISLGTVYRNLMVLKDAGKIRTVDVGDGVIHFDPDVSDHCHFICRKCGSVQDVRIKCGRELLAEASDGFRGQLTGCSVYFYGICENCLAEEQGTQESGKEVS